METLQFAYPYIIYFGLPVIIVGALVRFFQATSAYYYPLGSYLLADNQGVTSQYARPVLYILRLSLLIGLLALIARPQWVDTNEEISLNGIDIMLTLDVSGSMELFDDLKNPVTRIQYAKREALDFIDKRIDDQIGLVLFGREALSKIPLTLDKYLLREVVSGIKLGEIDQDGTALLTGLALSVNRLRESKAKSKIIVLLTDGISNSDNLKYEDVISIAKKLNIRVYTLGVGAQRGGYIRDNWGAIQQVAESLDEKLLDKIARETGGVFFRVYSQREMRKAYETIDQLEKSRVETQVYHKYYEAFAYFIWLILLLGLLDIFLKYYWWRGIL